MPKTEVEGAIYCGRNLVSTGTWGGVQISYLLQLADADPTGTNLEFHASDGYQINVAVEAALVQGFIIAYELNGQPLNEVLRLTLPGYPGNFWISMITEVILTKTTEFNIGPNFYTSQLGEIAPSMLFPTPSATTKPSSVPAPLFKNATEDGANSSAISIISPESNRAYTTNSVNLTFSVNQPNRKLSYSLDGYGNLIPGNTTFTGLSSGNHTLLVFATDPWGKMVSSEVAFIVEEPAALPPAPKETSAPATISPPSNMPSTSSNTLSFQAVVIVVIAVVIVIIVVLSIAANKRKKSKL
jgi:hypothetical protein